MGRNHQGENENQNREVEPADGEKRNLGVVVPFPERSGATAAPDAELRKSATDSGRQT